MRPIFRHSTALHFGVQRCAPFSTPEHCAPFWGGVPALRPIFSPRALHPIFRHSTEPPPPHPPPNSDTRPPNLSQPPPPIRPSPPSKIARISQPPLVAPFGSQPPEPQPGQALQIEGEAARPPSHRKLGKKSPFPGGGGGPTSASPVPTSWRTPKISCRAEGLRRPRTSSRAAMCFLLWGGGRKWRRGGGVSGGGGEALRPIFSPIAPHFQRLEGAEIRDLSAAPHFQPHCAPFSEPGLGPHLGSPSCPPFSAPFSEPGMG